MQDKVFVVESAGLSLGAEEEGEGEEKLLRVFLN